MIVSMDHVVDNRLLLFCVSRHFIFTFTCTNVDREFELAAAVVTHR